LEDSLISPEMLWEHGDELVGSVTGLFLSNENTIGPAVDLLALVLREASRDRRYEIIVEGQIELRDCRST